MYRWQYNGRESWTEIVNWCRDTFGQENFVPWHETIYFHDPEYYTMFMLRWS